MVSASPLTFLQACQTNQNRKIANGAQHITARRAWPWLSATATNQNPNIAGNVRSNCTAAPPPEGLLVCATMLHRAGSRYSLVGCGKTRHAPVEQHRTGRLS